MEQWRIAMISLKLWGELSPTKELPPIKAPIVIEASDKEAAKKKDDDFEIKQETKVDSTPTPKRSIGQAEIESAYFKVGLFN